MEEDESDSVLSSEHQTMDGSLEHIFTTMIRQGDTLSAVDFIRSIDINFLPSISVMRTVIFDILMKNEDIRCMAFSSDYLITVLNAFPPSNDNRQFYYDSIRGSHGCLSDLWTVFCFIINSYFYHRDIYVIDKDANSPDPIKYPNCKFLLEFYVKLFSVDFECSYSKSFSSCLIVKLLWPRGDICLSSQTELLLKWINDIYSNSVVNDMGDLLEDMHSLLTLMVRCMIEGKHKLSDYAAFSNPSLVEIVEAVINFCKNAFSNLPNVKLFLAFNTLKYLQAKLSEKIIRQIVRQSSKRSYALTLKDIVDLYMFPKKFNKWKIHSNIKEKNLRKRAFDKKTVISDKKMKTTELHELCRKNKYGDLLEALQTSSEDVNTRNHNGCTPLHEACYGGNFMCVEILIQEANKVLDATAANLEGATPLHIAISKNDTKIARKLLGFGGSELLTITDNKGHYPSDFSSSEEMDRLLQEYPQELSSFDPDPATENKIKEAPILKTFKEYSIYLHALNCLLCSYSNVFNLYKFIWKKNTVVQSHSDKLCCHYVGQDVCSDDADFVLEMPELIETFIDSVCKNVSKLELNVDIELIPLKTFAASLKASQ